MDGMGLISRDIFEEYLRQKHSDKMEEKRSIEMQPSVFLLEKEFIWKKSIFFDWDNKGSSGPQDRLSDHVDIVTPTICIELFLRIACNL